MHLVSCLFESQRAYKNVGVDNSNSLCMHYVLEKTCRQISNVVALVFDNSRIKCDVCSYWWHACFWVVVMLVRHGSGYQMRFVAGVDNVLIWFCVVVCLSASQRMQAGSHAHAILWSFGPIWRASVFHFACVSVCVCSHVCLCSCGRAVIV